MSKSFGLAGIRLGVTFAAKPVSRLLNSMKYPYNISNLTSNIGLRATSKEAIANMRKNCGLIVKQRDVVLKALQSLKGVGKNLGGLDSNFLLLEILNKEDKPDNVIAEKLYHTLATQKNVVVRFRGKELGCTGCLRITIGTEEENKTLIKEFETVLNEIYSSA
ncbi:unnamed protein product [Ambrosiozyma monospora]|uniref:Unnamed protein product n=1 Tax=Ambrosiozyma monospora TaxID=43982 RepID=A0ACB5TZV9_AMBMO|nr:unnamed protein product [Ambrosiozyma monospora]